MLSNNALLVYLSISRWTGSKQDRKANATVEQTHDVKARNAVKTQKSLLPGCRELTQVNKTAGDIRTFFYANTVPWQHGGMYMIRSTQFMDFMSDFNKLKVHYEAAVRALIAVYPGEREKAKNTLGTLYNEMDYPSENGLADTFACSMQVFPVPDVGDFRIELAQADKDAFIANLRQVEAQATRKTWERLHKVVKTAAEKLSQPDALFRNTLIENITDLCAILPRLNIMDDPALETARLEIETIASKLSPDVCRDNATERQDAAAKLKALTDKMSVFMVGAPAVKTETDSE